MYVQKAIVAYVTPISAMSLLIAFTGKLLKASG